MMTSSVLFPWSTPRRMLTLVLFGAVSFIIALHLHLMDYTQLLHVGRNHTTMTAAGAAQESWFEISMKNPATDGTAVFRYHPPNNSSQKGWPFTVPVKTLRSLGFPPKSYVEMTPEMAGEFIFATAASSAYVHMAQSTVASIHHYHPHRKIRVYDLGMTAKDIAKVKSWCNVEYVKFSFFKYPRHVRNNRVYSWKPIVIMHVLQTYPGVYWLDSSGRITTSNFTRLLQQVQQTHGGLLLTSTGHATFPVTHAQMYNYFPISMDVVKRQEQREATMLFYRTREMMTYVLPWLVFCALEQRCIAPSKNLFCNFRTGAERNTHYANCHRFDQSAVNILLLNYFNSSSRTFYASQRTVKIERFLSNTFKVRQCPYDPKETGTPS